MKKFKFATALLAFSTVTAKADISAVQIEVTYDLSAERLVVKPVSGGGNRNNLISAVANGRALLLHTSDSAQVNCPQIRDGVVPLIQDGWSRVASVSDIVKSGISVEQLRKARCVVVLPKLK